MDFQVGDRVSLIDEAGTLIVIAIEGIKLTVVDEFGFERTCSQAEVVIINEKQFENIEIDPYQEEVQSKINRPKRKQKQKHVPVIDLHMENLIDSHKHMSNHEIVLFQTGHFKSKLDNLIKNGVKELIVVHGIGTGKLKYEVRFILNGYPHIEYMDDHYASYGVGATRIFVH